MANVEDEASDEITPVVINTLEKFLDDKYGKEKYDIYIEEAANKGDNYMGVVYRITITPLSKSENVLKLILKVPPQNPFRRQQFFARAGFLREALAYEEFLPMVCAFQKVKGLPIAETFFEYPQCQFTLIDNLNEAICLNDLQVEGFYMHDRFEPLTLNHVVHLMRVYAKLHATSLVMKDQNPEKLENLQNIVDIFEQRKDDAQLNDYFESLKASALDSLDKETEIYYWQRLDLYFKGGKFYDLMLDMLDSKSSEPYSVVCHGDCWINNIMFKMEESKIIDARLIDWQIMRYASPIMDLMYFLMSCTTREFRKEYLVEIFNIYHCTASEHIKRLGSIPEKLYPRVGFDREFKCKGAIGLLFGMIVLPILTTKSEDAPNLEQLSEKVSAGQSTDAMAAGFVGAKSTLFNQRMRGIVMDSIDWNLI